MDGPTLPRSVRWRLQLGLWTLPGTGDLLSLAELALSNSSVMEDQRKHYTDMLEELKEVTEQEDSVQEAETNPPEAVHKDSLEVDPLTAIVQAQDAQEERLSKLDLKYRKERAMRKRGISSGGDDGDRCDTYSSSLTKGVIEKDLNRLQQDHHTIHQTRQNFLHPGQEQTFETTVRERNHRLAEILEVYALQYPHIGYRQGMHEVSSYLLLVVEMDIFDQESQQSEHTPLLDADYISHDTYSMLEAVMGELSAAYDVKMSPNIESPMEFMAQNILMRISETASDKVLHQHLMQLNCPPELFTTRWVRLMFSREVAGWKSVLQLWDIFFDLISKTPYQLTSMPLSRYTRPGVTPALRLGKFSLMTVLEASAASMILLQRSALLSAENESDSDSIHRLMNIPPLKNILPLTATLLSMLRRLQLHQAGGGGSPNSARRTMTLSEIAQNAINSSQQQIRSMWQSPAPQQQCTVSLNSNHSTLLKHHAPRERSLNRPVVNLSDPQALGKNMNDSIFTVKNYLMALENTPAGGGGATIGNHIIPQSVWDAVDDLDAIRKHLAENDSGDERQETDKTGLAKVDDSQM